ncbi:hypothetical protein RhiXN_00324 [Rhizoctonia solani]|uniref:Uncharacterized protein n=1 Tax=Rhizoctonia solani TaxID=456999 RepID=A0A8H8NU77_9AGAM|nr:uncharacterized protein RhiXN_00324 [Rhizoctonia solani]QRW18918.1 hypothetical protein RhiXN_00324 [Rhizoctonia solani]
MSTPRHPLSVVFLLHIAVEAPFALQGIWAGHSLPFIQLTNTTLVLLKLYSALLLASCLASLLCFNLPANALMHLGPSEFLPGKRAFALQLLAYHSIAATVLFQSPRFIPHSLGSVAESASITPEKIWGALHGVVSVLVGLWWQFTLGHARALKQT